MLFLFLLITIIISTLIVIFLSKIQALTAILEYAKEIDHAKEERIAFLDDALMEEKIHSFQIQKEVEYLEESKENLEISQKNLIRLKKQLVYKEKDYLEFSHEQTSSLEQLQIHYEILEESHDKVDEKYLALKLRNEDLFDEYNQLNAKYGALEVRFFEQQKKNSEKIQMMDEYKGELKEGFSQLASKIFEGNSKKITLKSSNDNKRIKKPSR
jgi:hypothetical protein